MPEPKQGHPGAESTAQRVSKADARRDRALLFDIFCKWDDNKDGSISCGEMRRVLLQIGFKAEDVKRLFNEIDANHDGQIAYDEFCSWLFAESKEDTHTFKEYIYRTESPKQALTELMSFIQTLMEESQMKAVKSDDGKEGEVTLRDIFSKIDASGNQVINMSEFVAGIKSLGFKIDDKMAHEIFQLIDSERRRAAASRAPRLKEGWDDDFQNAGVDAKKHTDVDPYAVAGVPNTNKEATRYTGSASGLQGKLVHHPYAEYDEIMEQYDPVKKRMVKVKSRTVNQGGVADNVLTFREFKKAFLAAAGQ